MIAAAFFMAGFTLAIALERAWPGGPVPSQIWTLIGTSLFVFGTVLAVLQ
jgi:hypothetical protein